VLADVASASQLQRDGIATIGRAVDQMNAVTQQVAANAEESASAAEELAGQATTMNALVNEFTLSDQASSQGSLHNSTRFQRGRLRRSA